MLCAALIVAHQVAGKATRDALFLSVFSASDLPKMVMVAATLSLALGWVFFALTEPALSWQVFLKLFGM